MHNTPEYVAMHNGYVAVHNTPFMLQCTTRSSNDYIVHRNMHRASPDALAHR